MKIFYDAAIFRAQQFGGVSRYHIQLARYMRDVGHCTVRIPMYFFKNEYLKSLRNVGAHFAGRELIKGNMKLDRLVTALAFCLPNAADVVHTTWYDPYVTKHHPGKLVVTVHDLIQEVFPEYFEKDLWTVPNRLAAMTEADKIIAISENTKKDLLRFYPQISQDKIVVVYHGTNHLPEPQKPECEDFPIKYLLYVGERRYYKNFLPFIKAMTPLIKKNPDLTIVCVGGGSFRADETDFFCQEGISQRVRQYNLTDSELAFAYANAECFVYPSCYEGFGFPILEAFDNHCPVALSNASCLPEVGGDAARYFDPNNLDEMRECVEGILNDAELRQTLISAGTKRVAEFSWDKAGAQTLAVYQDVCEQK